MRAILGIAFLAAAKSRFSSANLSTLAFNLSSVCLLAANCAEGCLSPGCHALLESTLLISTIRAREEKFATSRSKTADSSAKLRERTCRSAAASSPFSFLLLVCIDVAASYVGNV